MTIGADYFPPSLLDPRQAARYAPHLKALGEQPLRSAQPLAVRLLCLPTWGGACFIRVEDCGIRWHCAAGELDGDAGYEVGTLVHRKSIELTSTQTAHLAEMWRHLRFRELPAIAEGNDDELDGTDYVLETTQDGWHGVVVRVTWEWGDTFGEFVDLLFDYSGLHPR